MAEKPTIVDETPDKLDRIMSFLENVSDRLTALESKQPKFVPMRRQETARRNTYVPPDALQARVMKSLTKRDQQAIGSTTMLDDPEYIAKIPPQYRPAFVVGELVQINPDAKVHGSDKLWADALAEANSDGIGEVISTMLLTKDWEPKYKVAIPGITKGNGGGFREHELLPFND